MSLKGPVATLPKRGTDRWGSGSFRASRGDRVHDGVDYACYPGTTIYPVYPGRVTKLGYPYSDDFSFRYVEIEDSQGYKCRYFYVTPLVEKHDRVGLYTPLGTSQMLGDRYPEITEHIHIEVRNPEGFILDPESYHVG